MGATCNTFSRPSRRPISGPLLLTTRKNSRVYAVMRAILLSSGNARCEYALRARLSSSLLTRGGGEVPGGGRNQLISKQFLERVRLRGQTIPISSVLDAANLPSFADLAFRGHSSVFEPANTVKYYCFYWEDDFIRRLNIFPGKYHFTCNNSQHGQEIWHISLIHCTDTVD